MVFDVSYRIIVSYNSLDWKEAFRDHLVHSAPGSFLWYQNIIPLISFRLAGFMFYCISDLRESIALSVSVCKSRETHKKREE